MTKQLKIAGLACIVATYAAGCRSQADPYAKAPSPDAMVIECGEKMAQDEPPSLNEAESLVVKSRQSLRVRGTIRFASDYADWGSCLLEINTLGATPTTVASANCEKLVEVSDHLHEYSIELTGPQQPGKYRVDVKLLRGRPTYLHSVMLEVK